MRRLGVGYREMIAAWIESGPAVIDCLELTAEHFFDNADKIPALTEKFPVFLHGLGLSLGTPGPIDPVYLEKFRRVCAIAKPEWVSEHIAFTQSGGIDLGHLNPISYSETVLQYFVDHAIEMRETCACPLLLENIATHVQVDSDLHETQFINRLCESAGTGLLLDVTNLYVNSKNHGYDAMDWLREIHPTYIKQLHVVGYSHRDGAYHDSHSEPIQPPIMQLIKAVIEYSDVQTIILERDSNFPPIAALELEFKDLRGLLDAS